MNNYDLHYNKSYKYNKSIVLLIGHSVATWYTVFRYVVKLTELETSWGVAIPISHTIHA